LIPGAPAQCPTIELNAEVFVASETAFTGTGHCITVPASGVNPGTEICWYYNTISSSSNQANIGVAGVNTAALGGRKRGTSSFNGNVNANPSSNTVVGQVTSVPLSVTFDPTKFNPSSNGTQICLTENVQMKRAINMTQFPHRTMAAVAYSASNNGPFYPITGGSVNPSGQFCINTKKPGYFATARLDTGTQTVQPSQLPNAPAPGVPTSSPTPTQSPTSMTPPTTSTPPVKSAASEQQVVMSSLMLLLVAVLLML